MVQYTAVYCTPLPTSACHVTLGCHATMHWGVSYCHRYAVSPSMLYCYAPLCVAHPHVLCHCVLLCIMLWLCVVQPCAEACDIAITMPCPLRCCTAMCCCTLPRVALPLGVMLPCARACRVMPPRAGVCCIAIVMPCPPQVLYCCTPLCVACPHVLCHCMLPHVVLSSGVVLPHAGVCCATMYWGVWRRHHCAVSPSGVVVTLLWVEYGQMLAKGFDY